MGCRDAESNFQTLVYNFVNGEWGWWCAWGPFMVESPDLDVLKEKLSNSPDHWDVEFDTTKNRYVAVPGEGTPGVFVKS